MEDKKFDEMFRPRKDRNITPSSHALKNLQEALNEADTTKKRKPLVFGWIAAAVAVVAILIGVDFYSIDNPMKSSKSITETRDTTESKLEREEESLDLNTELAEIKEPTGKGEVNKYKSLETELVEVKTRDVSEPAMMANRKENEVKREDTKEHKEEFLQVEKEVFIIASEEEKRKEELLKPIDDAQLNSLLQQEQVALAIEELEDADIMQLLYEAQNKLEVQGEGQLASFEAERLLKQASIELKAD